MSITVVASAFGDVLEYDVNIILLVTRQEYDRAIKIRAKFLDKTLFLLRSDATDWSFMLEILKWNPFESQDWIWIFQDHNKLEYIYQLATAQLATAQLAEAATNEENMWTINDKPLVCCGSTLGLVDFAQEMVWARDASPNQPESILLDRCGMKIKSQKERIAYIGSKPSFGDRKDWFVDADEMKEYESIHGDFNIVVETNGSSKLIGHALYGFVMQNQNVHVELMNRLASAIAKHPNKEACCVRLVSEIIASFDLPERMLDPANDALVAAIKQDKQRWPKFWKACLEKEPRHMLAYIRAWIWEMPLVWSNSSSSKHLSISIRDHYESKDKIVLHHFVPKDKRDCCDGLRGHF